TNHLDIPAREVLERGLKRYEGTLLVVSHDRFFLDEVVTSILVVEHGGVELHRGTFSDWRRRLKEAARAPKPVAAPARPAPSKVAADRHGEDRARKAEREKLERRQA